MEGSNGKANHNYVHDGGGHVGHVKSIDRLE